MKEKSRSAAILCLTMIVVLMTSTRLPADTGTCGGAVTTLPFTDVMGNIFFCQIAEAYLSGLTNGTTPTTYSPNDFVRRDQMAALTTRTQDSALRKGSRRAALNQWWTTQTTDNLGLTTVGGAPRIVQSDGADLWVANQVSGTVSQVQASNGKLLGTWTGAGDAWAVLVAMGKVFVTSETNPGNLYGLDPAQAPGDVVTVTDFLGGLPLGIAFDGQKIWTANNAPGSVSIVNLGHVVSVNTVTAGFNRPVGILFDGSNIWITDGGDNTLKKLDASGNILLAVNVGNKPQVPVFDGTNIWVPNFNSNSITVVRATGGLAGTVLATLTGNGLNEPVGTAFDGQRVLVTNAGGDSVSLWNASDLTPIGTVSTGSGTQPFYACSDGVNLWITFFGTSKLARF